MNPSGGFLPFSPPPSSVASSHSPHALPHPRASPLRPGGSKESNFIRHVDQQLLRIQRRFAKRDAVSEADTHADEQGRHVVEEGRHPTAPRLDRSEQWQDVPGYTSFAQAARDVEALLGIIWISGTPSLQTPYLISLALLTSTLISGFPTASPRHLFRLLGKLDHAFASLLRGQDVETGETLPGFDLGQKVSVTEKVRIKSLVERTRISVSRVVGSGDFDDEVDSDEEEAEDDAEELEGDLVMDDVEIVRRGDATDWDMDVARVYDKTLVEIGDSTDGPAIGIVTG